MKYVWLVVAVFALACTPSPDVPTDAGPDAGPDSGPDPDVDAGDDTPISLEDFLRDNNVTTLELQPDGSEYGEAMSDANGIAWFYSPVHGGVYEMSVLDPDMEMGLVDRAVQLAVGEENLAYMITDPTGVYAPLLHTLDLPMEDAMYEVNALDNLVTQADIDDYDPEADGNPFEMLGDDDIGRHSAPLTIIGINISISIGSILSGIATGAVFSVFKSLVVGACGFVAPLYAERCELVGNIFDLVAKVAAGVFITGASAWALGATIFEGVLATTGYTCEAAGGAFIGYVTDPNDRSGRDRYREVARRYNYLLYQMETDPQPGQPTWEQATAMGNALVAIREVVRNRYFQLWNGSEVGLDASTGFWLGVSNTAMTEFMNNVSGSVRADVVASVTMSDAMRSFLSFGSVMGTSTYRLEGPVFTQANFSSFELDYAPSGFHQAMNGLIGGCIFTFVQGMVVKQITAGVEVDINLETEAIVRTELEVIQAAIDLTYQENWGDVIPPGTCVVDDYEPNSTWSQAFGSPVPTMLGGGGIVTLNELTLCDAIGGSGNDDDWYGYYIGPIDLRVEARLTNVAGGAGEDERVCIDINFYSEIFELIGDPPTLITTACGRVGDWPGTSPFSVARTTGERWSMILLHVRHEGGGSMGDVEYGLRFTP